MKFKFLQYLALEILIVCGFLFTINNYIGSAETTISADGVGYYDYLPSIFIHKDFVRKNDNQESNPKLYERINGNGPYIKYGDYKVNKYPCGTAILQLPFFAHALLTNDLDNNKEDGYQRPFQRAALYSAIFYLFLILYFLRKILLLYDIKRWVIFYCQALLVLATSLTHYANVDAGFSHVYSLFAITLFVYTTKLFFDRREIRYFILSFALLGLIFNIRNPNILIVLLVPFLAGSKENLFNGFRSLFAQKKAVFIGVILFLAIVSIQLISWYLQVGSFLVYSYQGEGFDYLLEPKIYDVLFSYRKGLFVYTPVLLIMTLSIIWFAIKRQYYLLYSWLFLFLGITYLISSWHSWYYGCAFGMRVYIDFYIVFIIPFAIVLNRVNILSKIILVGLTMITVPINVIQTYQYKEYILHWIDMDKEKYWKVFLKTDDKYKSLVWKQDYDFWNNKIEKEILLGDFTIPHNTVKEFIFTYDEIPNFNKVNNVQVLMDDSFYETDESSVILKIDDSNGPNFWHHLSIINFHEKELNQWQTGLYNFKFVPFEEDKNIKIIFKLITGNQEKDKVFKNVRLKFCSPK
ncbi:MAG: hypothetical protein ACI9XP_001319 [Lentimonas sp.]|jgi:hypothetical protein